MLRLFDSDGTTQLTYNDQTATNDSLITYTLPHDGDYYVSVEDWLSRGGTSYFYTLLLNFSATLSGTISSGSSSQAYANVFVYKTSGVFQYSSSFYGAYSLVLPPGDYKVYCFSPSVFGTWFNSKGSFAGADSIHLSPAATATANFSLVPRATFYPQLNKTFFKTGDRLQVDIQIANGSTPSKVMVFVHVLYPESGLKDAVPIGNRLTIYYADIDIPANANFAVANFFSYVFTGAEPPGIYYVRIIPLDLFSTYGYNYLNYSYYQPSFIFAP
jgi:hypothetical protein